MIRLLLSVFLPCFLIACSPEKKTEAVTEFQVAPTETLSNQPASEYKFSTILSDSTNPSLGFGYNIIIDGHIYIHQPSVPSVAGNKGFTSKEKAETTANFVIYKLTHHIMPPSLSPMELDSLGVLN